VSQPVDLYGVSRAAVIAATEMGETYNPDYNGENQIGWGQFQQTIKGGERWSAYRYDFRRRRNVEI